MSVHPFPIRAPAGIGLAEAGWHLRAAVTALRAGTREALRRRRTRKNLAGLDNHLLRDIGITPTEAAREANKPFWQL